VTDAASGPVAQAAVNVKNLETDVVRTASTDEAGRYLVLALPVGRYEVRISKSGFQDAVRSGISLVVGQEASVDLRLQVSAVKSEVKVTSDAGDCKRDDAGHQRPGGRAGGEGSSIERTELRPAAAAEPRHRQFHFAKNRRNGDFELQHREQFFRHGQSPAAEYFSLNGVEYTGAAENNMTPGGPSGMPVGRGGRTRV